MHYKADTSGIRDAKEKVDDVQREIDIAAIQKEIDLLEDQKDLLNEQITLLDEQADKINKYYDAEIEKTKNFYDEQIKGIDKQIEALDKQKEQTEKYFESIINAFEESKSKYQELTELVDKAELSAKLKQFGIDEEALLNGSQEEFEKLKNAYMDVVFRLNEGNEDVLSSLRELSGYEGTAPSVLTESTDKLEEMNGKLDTSGQNLGAVNTSLADTASKTGDVATNVSDLTSELSKVSTIVTDELAAFDNLKLKIDEVVTAINEKIAATQAGQLVSAVAMSTETANLILLKEKILEVKKSLDDINTSISSIDLTAVNGLATAFQALYTQLVLVSATLGAGTEGEEEGAVSGIVSAIEALNNISLEEGIIAQFTNLKTAIDEVASAIGGGGGTGEGASGGEGSGGSSGSKSGGGESGGGSEGEGGGSNSLTGAITEMGETANEVIGEPGAEGDGTVIGEFGSMKTAVDDVTTAIGGGGDEGGEGEGSGGGEGEDDGNLISSIETLGETTQEELGESGGDGIIGKFEEFRDVAGEANEHVTGISEGLNEIDGKEVECTIKVNIETTGGLPAGLAGATGTALDTMKLESAEYNAKYGGSAHYEGTAKVTGDWGVRNGGNTLVGELGQEIVVRGSRFFTVGDSGAEFINLQKGDIVFNHKQTRELLSKGSITGNGRGKALASGTALANGTDSNGFHTLCPSDKEWDLMQLCQASVRELLKGESEIAKTTAYEMQKQINDGITRDITNLNNISNITNNRNTQPVVNNINVTCPGVTEQQVAERLGSVIGKELDKQFSGFHNYTDQMSRVR